MLPRVLVNGSDHNTPGSNASEAALSNRENLNGIERSIVRESNVGLKGQVDGDVLCESPRDLALRQYSPPLHEPGPASQPPTAASQVPHSSFPRSKTIHTAITSYGTTIYTCLVLPLPSLDRDDPILWPLCLKPPPSVSVSPRPFYRPG